MRKQSSSIHRPRALSQICFSCQLTLPCSPSPHSKTRITSLPRHTLLPASLDLASMVSKNSEHFRPQIAVPQVSTQTPNDNPMSYGATPPRQGHVTKKFVLCFDGTGNKFSGTDADSNILKIYRMLDRNGDDQFHYYQPGIGTYVTKANGSMTRTGRWEKFQSWYAKAKDSAIGTFEFICEGTQLTPRRHVF